MALIPPHFVNSVVAIGNRSNSGEPEWVGSGFFYGHKIRELDNGRILYRTYLVTNKHVHATLTCPVVRANGANGGPAELIPLALSESDGRRSWVGHPDVNVDVVVTGIAMDALSAAGYDVAYIPEHHAVTTAAMANLGIVEGDGVFILGFPMGMVGVERSAVIVRGGTLARVADTKFGLAPTLLVDGYVFPGNSGGPVFSRPESIAIQGTAAVGSSYLLGIIASYVPYRDIAVSPQTRNVRVVFEENSGLAHVFPVERITETIALFEEVFPAEPPAEEIKSASPNGAPSLGS